MTTVADLGSGPVQAKSWLNIIAGSINAGAGGGGVTTSLYSIIGSKTVTNVTGPVSLTASIASIGSLALPPLQIGSVLKLTVLGSLGLNTSSSAQVALYINGANVTGLTGMGTTGGSPTVGSAKFEAFFTVRAAGLAAGSIYAQVSPTPITPSLTLVGAAQGSGFAFDPTLATNTIDIFIQFNAASTNSNFVVQEGWLDLVYPNL